MKTVLKICVIILMIIVIMNTIAIRESTINELLLWVALTIELRQSFIKD